MWLSLSWFIMHTWVMHTHLDELAPEQSGPILLCNILCYAVLAIQCCRPNGTDWTSVFVIWASILLVCLLILLQPWSLISSAWVFSSICTQLTIYEYETRR